MTESQTQQLQIFSTYLDIYDIEHTQTWIDTATDILNGKYSQIKTFHPFGFVFFYFDHYVRGEINLEQFMTMGDIEGSCVDQINPHIYKRENPCFLDTTSLEELLSYSSDTLVIIEELVRAFINRTEQKTPPSNIIVL